MKNVNGYGQKGKTLGDMAFGNTLAAKLAKGSYSNGHFYTEANRESSDINIISTSSPSPLNRLEIYAGNNVTVTMKTSLEATEKQNYLFSRKQKYVVNGDVIIYGNGDNHINSTSKNDLLAGGNGNDTYFFYKGQGNDIIYDIQGKIQLL